MPMSKAILISKEYMSDVCDVIGEALDECAKNTLRCNMSGIVTLTVCNYKELLLNLLFEKEGENNG